MAKILDVAQFIYDELGWVDAWRLEKLTYYADSWFAAWYGEPLFNEKFEAWVDGPVAPVLYHANKDRDSLMSPNLPQGDGGALRSHEAAAISSVLDFLAAGAKCSSSSRPTRRSLGSRRGQGSASMLVPTE